MEGYIQKLFITYQEKHAEKKRKGRSHITGKRLRKRKVREKGGKRVREKEGKNERKG